MLSLILIIGCNQEVENKSGSSENEMKKGGRLRMEGSYKPEDQINLLIKELNLENKKANVQQRI